jgi:hypothetical protein
MFQFKALPYDEVAQIGMLIGLHFREFHDREIEDVLLLEPNFRDLVLKIFVDEIPMIMCVIFVDCTVIIITPVLLFFFAVNTKFYQYDEQ